MATSAKDLSTQITLRAEEITQLIERLLSHQNDIQEDILKLQIGKRNGEPIDEDLLAELKKVRKDASTEIGLLALERTELFDDLPVIRLASGKLKVIASELERDAALIEETAEKIKRVTKVVQKAEKLAVKIISLVGMI